MKSGIEKELAGELKKRESIRAKQMAMYDNGTHSRAKSTTLNAELGRVQDRIVWLQDELKKARLNVQCATLDNTIPSKEVARIEEQIRTVGKFHTVTLPCGLAFATVAEKIPNSTIEALNKMATTAMQHIDVLTKHPSIAPQMPKGEGLGGESSKTTNNHEK